jgi:hypothetical protein
MSNRDIRLFVADIIESIDAIKRSDQTSGKSRIVRLISPMKLTSSAHPSSLISVFFNLQPSTASR